ncbi:MAG: RNA 2'-phosphotransferase [Candidatus Brocadiia bacterium]
MTRDRKLVKLSKRLSYLLRHHPEKLDLDLDREGFTTITLPELARRMGTTEEVLRRVVATDPKERFTIRDGRIRANYGHSIHVGRTMYEDRPPATRDELPDVLYHGTAPGNVDQIMRQGLRSRGRQLVHLSTSDEWARTVGSRHARAPVVIRIHVPEALRRGVRMWPTGPATVLATDVPPECMTVEDGD